VVDCLVMARPTKSAVLFQQMVGRGMRLFPDKHYCLILDFVDNCTRNQPVTVPSLLGLDPDTLMTETLVSPGTQIEIEQEEKEIDAELKREIDETVSLFALVTKDKWKLFDEHGGSAPPIFGHQKSIERISEFEWVSLGPDTFVMGLFGNKFIRLGRNAKSGMFESFECHYKGSKFYRNRIEYDATESLEMAVKATDTWLTRMHSPAMGYRRNAAWRQKPATEAQLTYLKRIGKNSLPVLHKLMTNESTVDDWLQTMSGGQVQRLLLLLKFGKGRALMKMNENVKPEKKQRSFEHIQQGPLQ
jgi:ATP-dependent helicase IRC3